MAGSFPTLSGGGTVLYPLRLIYSCATRVVVAASGAEQRWVVRPPMIEVDATYRSLTAADQAAIDSFFDSQKGAADSTWTMAFLARTYTSMRFLDDEIRWEETLPARWTARLRSRGFHPAIVSPPSSLPSLASGAVTQLPWSKSRKYATNMTDLESGDRISLPLRGGGLSGLPTTPARAWQVVMRSIRDSEAASFVDFFVSQNGRFGSFSWQDPDTLVTYTGCRFGSDDLEVRYDGFNRVAMSFEIQKN